MQDVFILFFAIFYMFIFVALLYKYAWPMAYHNVEWKTPVW